ncbi:hypothetical protein [Vogesella sp. XCS3]|uniref:hypothetical protein n=1 Tax=Vogesella sp. XCS3 TaxID=2877939 RepID=UPI001D0BA309|nr:hypothetical protein [Vogesella sp. XCS3]UDM18427.1 hypothetical protein LCH97_07145 [Vogesella sp. XCS3]
MITTENLPVDYKPYDYLNFCSNVINGGGHIFAVGKTLPLLIGVGPAPRVWLQAVAAPGSKEFVPIVADSISTHPAVSVETMGSKIVVSVHGKIVLKAETKGDLKASVSEIDFRPLGLNVIGSPMGLSLGGMQLSRNTFTNVGIAFGLGE